MLIVLAALLIFLKLFPQIPNNSLIIAIGILASAIEIYGFVRNRKSKEGGPETNIAGPVQGSVLSGQFDGPVAAGAGAEAVDLRGATGSIYKPSGPVHTGDNITQIVQRDKLPVPRLPAPPQNFTGRDDELKRLLKVFDQGASFMGLFGAGGTGKTALALVLADRLKSQFPDGQILLKLEGTSTNPLKPADAMAQVVRAFRGAEERLPEGQNELQILYNSVLDGKSVLLLLDNAFDDRQVLPLLPPKGCAVLVTSRRKFTLPGMPEPFVLGTLEPSEARDLLLKICPRVGTLAGELAKLCGHLPLALQAAASLLAVKNDLMPSSFIEELRSERTRLEKIGKEGVELDVDSSFGLSYGRLKPEEARVFRELSVFPSDFDAQAEEAVCQDEGHRHLSELVRWSLVEYQLSEAEGAGRYHLHDLVRIFAASRLQDREEQEAQQRHAEHYRDVLSTSNKLYTKGGKNVLAGLALFDLEWANIQAGWAWAESNLQDSSFAYSLASSYPNAGAYLLDLRLHPRERIRWLETAVAAARILGDRRMEGVHLGNLSAAYGALGDSSRFIEYSEQRKIIAREIGDRAGEEVALGNLGNVYANMDDAYRAIEYYEQALAIAEERGDRRNEGIWLGNLGGAYADLGDAKKAIEYHEQALVIDREIGNRMGESVNLGNLGRAYAELGDARKAIEYHEQALEIDREIGYRRGEGIELGNLGNAYAALGDAKKAIGYYEQALEIAREIGNKQREGVRLCNLGIAYADLGDARKAIDYYEQALVIAREIGDRRGEGNALFNMSLALGSLDKRADAVLLAREALQIYEQIESPYADRVRRQLAEWS